MRIAQVCPGYFPSVGGLERIVQGLSEKLAQLGYDVEVLTTDPTGLLPSHQLHNHVLIRRFRSIAPGDAFFISTSLNRYIDHNSGRYEVVHAHGYHTFPALYAAKAKRDNKLVFQPYYHGDGKTIFTSLLLRFYRPVGRTILKSADHIVCNSRYERALLESHFKLDPNRVSVISPGLGLIDFEALAQVKRDNRLILSVARLEQYKGLGTLIYSMQHLDKSYRLQIIGRGKYKDSLTRLTSRLGLQSRVRIVDPMEPRHLMRKYAEAGVLVLLSRYESFGMVVMEALAAGTPCIVANSGALSEWVDNKNCHGIDYPFSPANLADLVEHASGQEVKGMTFGNWDDTARKMLKLYGVRK